MPDIQTFSDLAVWKVGVDLTIAVYRVTEGFPGTERFVLVSQMRRAAVSIGANIAEGNSRYSTPAYLNHVNMALGSHGELRGLLLISERLGFTDAQSGRRLTELIDELGRLLSGLRRALLRRLEAKTGLAPSR